MKEISVIIWLIGGLLSTIGLIMLYINYRMGRSLKKPIIIGTIGCGILLTIVTLSEMGKI